MSSSTDDSAPAASVVAQEFVSAAAQETATLAKQGLHYGSGTTSTLAINAFQQRVERNRTRDRRSESSMPRSMVSYSRQNSGRTVTGFQIPAASTASVASARAHTGAYDDSGDSNGVGPFVPAPFVHSNSSPGAMDLVQSMINSSPGCYAGDDGSVDLSDRYNFFVHGKRFLVRRTLCVSGRDRAACSHECGCSLLRARSGTLTSRVAFGAASSGASHPSTLTASCSRSSLPTRSSSRSLT